MLKENISIISLPQLKDNYSYLVIKNKRVIIIDPAESTRIIEYIKNNGPSKENFDKSKEFLFKKVQTYGKSLHKIVIEEN